MACLFVLWSHLHLFFVSGIVHSDAAVLYNHISDSNLHVDTECVDPDSTETLALLQNSFSIIQQQRQQIVHTNASMRLNSTRGGVTRNVQRNLSSSPNLLLTQHADERKRSNSTHVVASKRVFVESYRAFYQMATGVAFQVFVVVLIVIIGVLLVQGILVQRSPSRDEWQYTTGPAAAMLSQVDNKSFASPMLQDSRLPVARLSANSQIGASPVPQHVQPSLVSTLSRGFSGFAGIMTLPQQQEQQQQQHQDMGLAPTTYWSAGGYTGSQSICSIMQVREAEGIQLIIEGPLIPNRQQGFIKVKRALSDPRQELVMRVALSEQGRHDGVSIELPQLTTGPGSMPVAFLDTTECSTRGRVLIHQCPQGKFDRENLFAVAQMDQSGKCSIRRPGPSESAPLGELLYFVLASGYNTDSANITDGQGRLLATVTSRGQRENTRKLQISQHVDSVMMVAALISNVKLSR
jgi:hypothetical protein